MFEPRPVSILLADDDEDDRALIAEALREAHLNADLNTVGDGAELLDFLQRSGPSVAGAERARPQLILLDLNMPRMNGHEALSIIRQDPRLRSIPVVVLTTSTAPKDIARTYRLGGNSYITKPRGYDALVEMLRALSEYWLGVVNLPPAPAG